MNDLSGKLGLVLLATLLALSAVAGEKFRVEPVGAGQGLNADIVSTVFFD